MNKKTLKRQRDLKTKLMAAISMLLVSSLMLVTSTYAWFTLSTAPEVTGIQTAVGANGNLEMALLPESGDVEDITSDVSDSMYAVGGDIKEANVTWGNLVDVHENAVYGLDKIKLLPAALNENEGIIEAALLKTPRYGADGRVSELAQNTVTGVYDSDKGSFTPDADTDNTKFGVRAVGTTSGMTDRQLDYRNARSAANTARSKAASAAASALNTNGSALANIAIEYGMGADTAEYGKKDIESLRSIIDALQAENGVFSLIETAYLQYILAYAASSATGSEDDIWNAVSLLVEADNATLNGVVNTMNEKGYALPNEINDMITAYNDMVDAVTAADTNLETLEAELQTDQNATFTWAEIKSAMEPLVNPVSMKINGILASEVKEKISDLVASVTAQGGLKVIMESGAGVFADIADHTEDYYASVTIEKVEYNGVALNNMSARMETDSALSPDYHLVKLGNAVGAAGAPASGAAGTMPITDMYGYIIDLAFRTNAAESNLLLQREAVDRIYSDNTNEETMGHGASMTFAATTLDFSNDQVKALMDAIRIVFFEPSTRSVIANAKLDTANATSGTDGWTAEIYLYEESTGGDPTYSPATYEENSGKDYYQKSEKDENTYVEASSEDLTSDSVQLYTLSGDGTYTTATYDAEATGVTYYKVASTVKVDVYTKVTDEEAKNALAGSLYTMDPATAGQEVRKSDDVIMALTQNSIHKLSVLVYLDGSKLTNGSVAATDSTSMTGSMNLQFSSSAILVPMEYADLHTPGSGNTGAGTESGTEGTTP